MFKKTRTNSDKIKKERFKTGYKRDQSIKTFGFLEKQNRRSDHFRWIIRAEKQVLHKEENTLSSETLFMSNTTPRSHSASIQDFITP